MYCTIRDDDEEYEYKDIVVIAHSYMSNKQEKKQEDKVLHKKEMIRNISTRLEKILFRVV